MALDILFEIFYNSSQSFSTNPLNSSNHHDTQVPHSGDSSESIQYCKSCHHF